MTDLPLVHLSLGWLPDSRSNQRARPEQTDPDPNLGLVVAAGPHRPGGGLSPRRGSLLRLLPASSPQGTAGSSLHPLHKARRLLPAQLRLRRPRPLLPAVAPPCAAATQAAAAPPDGGG